MAVPGYALVRDERQMNIRQGRSQVSFTDVAALIDPTTVTFTSLSDPSTRVLEQNFQFDLVSTQKLLLKFIDKQVTVDKNMGNTVTPITGENITATNHDTVSATAITAKSEKVYWPTLDWARPIGRNPDIVTIVPVSIGNATES